jgi:hypothetical protein
MDNPIPQGSSPTLSCTVSLSPAVDVEIEIITEWRGPSYGLKEYTTTQPVMNSSAEVPTYTSTATLNAAGTFYDSGLYSCSVIINPLTNRDILQSFPAVLSQSLSGTSIESSTNLKRYTIVIIFYGVILPVFYVLSFIPGTSSPTPE